MQPTIAALVLALVACSPDAAPDSAPEPTAQPRIEPASDEPEKFVGVVTTRESMIVAAEFEGRVQALLVRAGQRVRTGDPIAKLDDTQLRKQLTAARAEEDAARAEISRAGVEVGEARRSARLARRLVRRGAIAREEVRKAEFQRRRSGATYGQAKAAHRRAVAERQQYENMLEKTTLQAPIDGVVSRIRVKEGEIARPGTPVARVFDPRDLQLRFAVDHERHEEVWVGAHVTATVPGVDTPFAAVVHHIATDLEPPLQLVIVDADIDDEKLSGQSVPVGIVGSVTIDEASP